MLEVPLKPLHRSGIHEGVHTSFMSGADGAQCNDGLLAQPSAALSPWAYRNAVVLSTKASRHSSRGPCQTKRPYQLVGPFKQLPE